MCVGDSAASRPLIYVVIWIKCPVRTSAWTCCNPAWLTSTAYAVVTAASRLGWLVRSLHWLGILRLGIRSLAFSCNCFALQGVRNPFQGASNRLLAACGREVEAFDRGLGTARCAKTFKRLRPCLKNAIWILPPTSTLSPAPPWLGLPPAIWVLSLSAFEPSLLSMLYSGGWCPPTCSVGVQGAPQVVIVTFIVRPSSEWWSVPPPLHEAWAYVGTRRSPEDLRTSFSVMISRRELRRSSWS